MTFSFGWPFRATFGGVEREVSLDGLARVVFVSLRAPSLSTIGAYGWLALFPLSSRPISESLMMSSRGPPNIGEAGVVAWLGCGSFVGSRNVVKSLKPGGWPDKKVSDLHGYSVRASEAEARTVLNSSVISAGVRQCG